MTNTKQQIPETTIAARDLKVGQTLFWINAWFKVTDVIIVTASITHERTVAASLMGYGDVSIPVFNTVRVRA